MIVEQLLNDYYAFERRIDEQDFPGLLTEKNCREGMEEYAALLDKLSSNWREADSCRDVEIRPVEIADNTGDSS